MASKLSFSVKANVAPAPKTRPVVVHVPTFWERLWEGILGIFN